MSGKRRKYEAEDKGAALAVLDANDGNVKGTARILDMPRKTLDDWARGQGLSPDVPEWRSIKKGTLAQKFEQAAHLILDTIGPGDAEGLRKAGVRDRMIAAGVAADKKLLLMGEDAGRFALDAQAESQMRAAKFIDEMLARARAAPARPDKPAGITRESVAQYIIQLHPEYAALIELAQKPCPLCGAPAEARPPASVAEDEGTGMM